MKKITTEQTPCSHVSAPLWGSVPHFPAVAPDWSSLLYSLRREAKTFKTKPEGNLSPKEISEPGSVSQHPKPSLQPKESDSFCCAPGFQVLLRGKSSPGDNTRLNKTSRVDLPGIKWALALHLPGGRFEPCGLALSAPSTLLKC